MFRPIGDSLKGLMVKTKRKSEYETFCLVDLLRNKIDRNRDSITNFQKNKLVSAFLQAGVDHKIDLRLAPAVDTLSKYRATHDQL